MKGQLSLEYLVLTVVTLAVIGIVMLTLVKIKNDADTALLLLKLKGDAKMIYNAVQDVCALGDGNARELELAGVVYGTGSGEVLELSNPFLNASIVYKTRCDVDIKSKLRETIIVENQAGEVRVRIKEP